MSTERGTIEAESEATLLDYDDLAKWLKVSRRTAEKMVADGHLPKPIRMGSKSRWDIGVLKEWARQQHKSAASPVEGGAQ